MQLTAAQLKAILPNATASNIGKFLPYLNELMPRYGITTPRRIAAFLGTIQVESGNLRYVEEIASGAAYEGQRDLGNTEPGDGVRFKGRGLIQLTGRANYVAFGNNVGVDFTKNPDLLETPRYAVQASTWFWNRHDLNDAADRGDMDTVTRKVRGALGPAAHQDQRTATYRRALAVLGDWPEDIDEPPSGKKW